MSEQETAIRSAEYVLEVRLADGDRIVVDAGSDPETARAELAALHDALEAGAFVQLGDVAIVRAIEIRSARVHRRGVNQSSFGTRPRGLGMGTYDTEQRNDVAGGHVPMPSGQQQQDGVGGFIDQYVGYGRRPHAETKPFWMTSEFFAALIGVAALGIALGTNDLVNGFRGWLLITIVASAYIISRGIAKAGASDPNPSRGDRRYGGQY
jgi:hypothetical protein